MMPSLFKCEEAPAVLSGRGQADNDSRDERGRVDLCARLGHGSALTLTAMIDPDAESCAALSGRVIPQRQAQTA